MFAPTKLIEHGDERVCKNCYKKRIEDTRQKLVKMGHAAASKRHEIKHIKWLLIVLAVLLLLGTYFRFFG